MSVETIQLVDHVRLVNSIKLSSNVTNYIFRGALPEFDNETFAYDELVSWKNSYVIAALLFNGSKQGGKYECSSEWN